MIKVIAKHRPWSRSELLMVFISILSGVASFLFALLAGSYFAFDKIEAVWVLVACAMGMNAIYTCFICKIILVGKTERSEKHVEQSEASA